MIAPTPGTGTYPSIFDDTPESDEYKTFKFWMDGCPTAFLSKTEDELLYEGILILKEDGAYKKKAFILTTKCLIGFENFDMQTIWKISSTLRFSKFNDIPQAENHSGYGPGFKIVKNDHELEFFTEDQKSFEDWKSAFRRMCVMTNFHETYSVFKIIGKGGFSRVYLAENKGTKVQYAVKALSKERIISTKKAKEAMKNEIDIMMDIDHPNIIKLHEAYESRGSVYLILELLVGGELMDRITKMGTYDEQDAKVMLGNLLRALRYLHSKKIMHRDLKPENILLKEDKDKTHQIKIVDFGLATHFDQNEYIYNRCGTPGFVAPEVFSASAPYDPVCDVFSIGIIFFMMLTGLNPFDDPNQQLVFTRNRQCEINFNIPELTMVTDQAKDLLKRMLTKNPKERITAKEALHHPYFMDHRIECSPSPMLRANVLENMKRLQQLKEKNLEIMMKYQIDINEAFTKHEGSFIMFGDLVSKKAVFNGRLDSHHDAHPTHFIGSLAYLQIMAGKFPKTTSPAHKKSYDEKADSSQENEKVDTEPGSGKQAIRLKKAIDVNKPQDDTMKKKALVKNQLLAEVEKNDIKRRLMGEEIIGGSNKNIDI